MAVSNNNNTDYYLEVASEDKYETAKSMRSQFEQRFEMELQKIAQSLDHKGGTKKAAKVHERIGRARKRNPSVQYYYDIDVTVMRARNAVQENCLIKCQFLKFIYLIYMFYNFLHSSGDRINPFNYLV